MPEVVELIDVAVDRGGLRILSDVTLTVRGGDVLGVVGPNGSGKTTLLRTIATLSPVSAGVVSLFGGLEARIARTRIGFIGHNPYLLAQLTLAENLEHIARLSGQDPARAGRALEVVGLGAAADRLAATASFGMLRRAEIAHLLIAKPQLLLLDEAVSGLDQAAHGLVESLISTTTDRGGAAIVVSHDETYLRKATDRVLSLLKGQIGVPE